MRTPKLKLANETIKASTEIEDDPPFVRIFLALILQIDGYIEAKFHILIP
jgi:hypothetical protein